MIGARDRETNQVKAKVIRNTDKKTLQRFSCLSVTLRM